MQIRTNPTREVAKEVLRVVDFGLVSGAGRPIPGEMCVEAAVCYALGEPHGDEPTCVGGAVRDFKISLNDNQDWSSREARAKGLRRVAIAQLGSDILSQKVFAQGLVVLLTQQVLAKHPHLDADLAQQCRDVRTFSAAVSLLDAISVRDGEKERFKQVFIAPIFTSNLHIVTDTLYNAVRSIAIIAKEPDDILSLAAECAVAVLQQMGSPGCEWLDLTELS